MKEYNQSKRGQQSRAIAYSGGGSRQLKGIVDNRNLKNTQTTIQLYLKQKKYPFPENINSEFKRIKKTGRMVGNLAYICGEESTIYEGFSDAEGHSEEKILDHLHAKSIAGSGKTVKEKNRSFRWYNSYKKEYIYY